MTMTMMMGCTATTSSSSLHPFIFFFISMPMMMMISLSLGTFKHHMIQVLIITVSYFRNHIASNQAHPGPIIILNQGTISLKGHLLADMLSPTLETASAGHIIDFPLAFLHALGIHKGSSYSLPDTMHGKNEENNNKQGKE